MLFHFVYMRRTLPPFQLQTVFWGAYFRLRAACLVSHMSEFVNYSIIVLFWVFLFLLQNHNVSLFKRKHPNWSVCVGDSSRCKSFSEMFPVFVFASVGRREIYRAIKSMQSYLSHTHTSGIITLQDD